MGRTVATARPIATARNNHSLYDIHCLAHKRRTACDNEKRKKSPNNEEAAVSLAPPIESLYDITNADIPTPKAAIKNKERNHPNTRALCCNRLLNCNGPRIMNNAPGIIWINVSKGCIENPESKPGYFGGAAAGIRLSRINILRVADATPMKARMITTVQTKRVLFLCKLLIAIGVIIPSIH